MWRNWLARRMFGPRAHASPTSYKSALEYYQAYVHQVGLYKPPLTKVLLDQTKNSVAVYANRQYFQNTDATSTMNRLLTQTAIASVDGDNSIISQAPALSVSRARMRQVPNGHPLLLSPYERLLSSKKIITSTSLAFKIGGYPMQSPLRSLLTPYYVGLLTIPGMQFEMDYMHYSLFFLDPYQHTLEPDLSFAHLYDPTLPMNYADAKKQLKNPLSKGDHFCHLTQDLFYICRRPNGQFYLSPFKTNAIIFFKEAYEKALKEDVALILATANEMAKQSGKPALLKATGLGMGYFSKIDGAYSIKHALLPNYLWVYKELLESNQYPHIASIEFPLFEENDIQSFKNIFNGRDKIGEIEVDAMSRDALEFTEAEREAYFPCVINPSDSNALAGNEWGYGSVESMIGLNTSLRHDQVYLMNPTLLDPLRHHLLDIAPSHNLSDTPGHASVNR